MEIKLKVEFLDMDKIFLTRQSGDTFTIPETKRNQEFFDFFHGEDKPQEQVNEDELYDSIYMEVVELVEKDNIQCEMYSETAKKLKDKFSITLK